MTFTLTAPEQNRGHTGTAIVQCGSSYHRTPATDKIVSDGATGDAVVIMSVPQSAFSPAGPGITMNNMTAIAGNLIRTDDARPVAGGAFSLTD